MWQLESYQMLPGRWVNSWSSSSSEAWRSRDQNDIIHFWWLVLNSALRHFTFCQTIILWLWAKCLPIFPSVGRHVTSNNSLCKHHSLSKYIQILPGENINTESVADKPQDTDHREQNSGNPKLPKRLIILNKKMGRVLWIVKVPVIWKTFFSLNRFWHKVLLLLF